MSDERKYYVLCEQNCKFESMTKEQILTAISQAVNEGTIGDIDTGFVTKIRTINNKDLKFFVGQQSEYELLTNAEKDNLFAIITNDTTKEALLQAISDLQKREETLEDWQKKVMAGETVIPKVTHASTADSATKASTAGSASFATCLNMQLVSSSEITTNGPAVSVSLSGGTTYLIHLYNTSYSLTLFLHTIPGGMVCPTSSTVGTIGGSMYYLVYTYTGSLSLKTVQGSASETYTAHIYKIG